MELAACVGVATPCLRIWPLESPGRRAPPVASLISNATSGRPSGDFCPRPFRSALILFAFWLWAFRALASGLCARPARTARSGGRGTLGRGPPRPRDFVGHETEAPILPRFRTTPERSRQEGRGNYAGGGRGVSAVAKRRWKSEWFQWKILPVAKIDPLPCRESGTSPVIPGPRSGTRNPARQRWRQCASAVSQNAARSAPSDSGFRCAAPE